MKKKLLDLLENHVDKLILCIIAIASLGVLWFFVIGSPYGAQYGRSNYGPGKIDAKIKSTAEQLEQRINGEATVSPEKYNGNKAGQMARLLAGSINIRENVVIRMAGIETGVTEDKRLYRKPSIGFVEGVDVELIRTAVFVPTEKVELTLPYSSVETEIDDIDFVTVQGLFDVAGLYSNFKKSFVDMASADDKDEELAVPVFASVGLERQSIGEDGQWSDWETVVRPKIDHRREMFVLPEKTGDIELGGVDLLIVNFDEFEVQKDLLQPVAYDIAASNEKWMTPTYHKEVDELLAKEIEDKEKEASGRVKPTRNAGINDMMGGQFGGMNQNMGGQRGAPKGRGRDRERDRRTVAATSRQERTIEDVEEDFDFAMLTEDIDLEIMKEPLVFWAHDETIEPLGTYRYRMRVGVFNPAAGKGWYSGADAEFKDDVVLWSDYSEVTGEIKVDPMTYFFPLKVTRGKKEATVQVSKFHEGKWQIEEFDVRVGEAIGKVVEVEAEVDNTMGRPKRRRTAVDIKTIDYSSGAILVDVVESKRSVSGGRLYQEILYSVNGGNIKHIGVGKRNWSKELSSTFNKIADEEFVEVVISKVRGQAGRRTSPGGGEGDFGGFDEMMMGPGGFGGEF